MAKPERAIEISTPCDLTSSSAEWAFELIEQEFKKVCHEKPIHVSYECKASLRAFMAAPIRNFYKEMLKYPRIPFHLMDDYDWDEWSILATAVCLNEPHIYRAEVWSPGA